MPVLRYTVMLKVAMESLWLRWSGKVLIVNITVIIIVIILCVRQSQLNRKSLSSSAAASIVTMRRTTDTSISRDIYSRS